MANTLKIIKKSTKVFWHIHNNLNTQKFAISDFEISLDGNSFKIVEIDGAKRYNYLVENITIIDETGTSAVETFTNADDFYNRLIAIQYTPFYNPLATSSSDNKIVSQAGFLLTGTNLTVNANWIWKILGNTYSNPSNVILSIPYCATGKKRIDYIVPNSTNGFTRISGQESTTILEAPSLPNENMYVTYFIVTDLGIGTPTPPVIGDAYITKREKSAFQVWNSGEINNTFLDEFYYGYLNFRGAVTNLKSIRVYTNIYLYSEKEILVKNSQTTNITIFHLSGTPGFQFSFPNALNLVLKPNEIIRFSMKITSPTEGVLEYVGKMNDIPTVDVADVVGLDAELANRYTKSEVDSKVSSVYRFKNNVANYAALPSTGLTAGDVYNLSDTGANYAWTGTVWDELGTTVDISGKENTSNKSDSYTASSSITYPNTKALVDGLYTKQNTLTNPVTGVGSNLDPKTYALQDGTILYHSTKWFTPTGTVSSSGTTVTSVGAQFTSEMVGAKLTINGEWRIITAYTSSTIVTVASAYSTNYSGVVAENWGVFSKAEEVTSTSVNVINQTGVIIQKNISNLPDSSIRLSKGSNSTTECGFIIDDIGGQSNRLGFLYQYGNGNFIHGGSVFMIAQNNNINFTRKIFLPSDKTISFSSTTSVDDTKDLGLRRNAAGVLEVFNGVTADGNVTNRRDLLVRNISATSSVQVGDNVAVASSTNVGSIRYRTSGNNSYSEMCMQTGAGTYAWVIIVENNW